VSIAQAAEAAVSVFGSATVETTAGQLPLSVAMVAIAGAETGGTYDPQARGDYGLDPSYGLCDGYSSWGLWQIHNVHRAYLIRVTGSFEPCAWASWLGDPMNCARAALAVYEGQGLGAWTTYTDGVWRRYLADAQQAVSQAIGQGSGTSAPKTPAPRQPSDALLLAGVGAAAAAVAAGFLAFGPELRQDARGILADLGELLRRPIA
jgi:hypothetical protein